MTKVGVVGAAGKMGKTLIALIHDSDQLELVAAVEQAGSSSIDADAGDLAGLSATGVIVTDELPGNETVWPAGAYVLELMNRASRALAIFRMSAIVRFCFARCIAAKRLGTAIAARMPIIATTIKSSISVKPRRCRLIECIVSSLSGGQREGRHSAPFSVLVRSSFYVDEED